MKRFFFVFSFLVSGVLPAAEATNAELEHKAEQVAMKLGGTLKKQLSQKMTEEGILGALDFCSLRAGALGDEVNKSLTEGWSVSRVSDKNRNPGNALDTIDAQAFQHFKNSKATSHWINEEDKAGHILSSRYYKPIRIEAMCLACHGTSISAPVAQKIKEKYPNDKATGYKVGDLRGLFKVQIARKLRSQ